MLPNVHFNTHTCMKKRTYLIITAGTGFQRHIHVIYDDINPRIEMVSPTV